MEVSACYGDFLDIDWIRGVETHFAALKRCINGIHAPEWMKSKS
jgi:hypothetical protein